MAQLYAKLSSPVSLLRGFKGNSCSPSHQEWINYSLYGPTIFILILWQILFPYLHLGFPEEPPKQGNHGHHFTSGTSEIPDPGQGLMSGGELGHILFHDLFLFSLLKIVLSPASLFERCLLFLHVCGWKFICLELKYALELSLRHSSILPFP